MSARPTTTARTSRVSGGTSDDTRQRILADMPVSERRLVLAGVPTAILEGGEGPALVLLHSAGEFAATWKRTIPGLAKTNRVIVPDLPGHGASGTGDGRLDRTRVLTWVSELIDETCTAPPALVGHLMGGAIAARFAVEDTAALRGLVLVDTLGLSWFRPAARFAFAMVGFVARPTERSRDRLFDQCFVDLEGIREETDGAFEVLERYALERARDPKQKKALNALMPRFGIPPIPARDLAAIDVPTSLIHGREDRQVRLRTAENASRRYGWPLHVIDDCADDPPAEQPDEFVDALRAALDA